MTNNNIAVWFSPCRYFIFSLAFLFISPIVASPTTPNYIQILNNADPFLKDKNFQGLFDYLISYEFDFAGQAEYDYVLGLAALESNQPNLAVQILQRAVDVDALFSGARMALARAYFSTGDLERAKFHFTLLLEQNPPAKAQPVIKQYLANIEQLSKNYSASLHTYLELGMGFDSNANASTDLDLFYGFQLDPKNIETQSVFSTLLGALKYNYPIDAYQKLTANMMLGNRTNASAHYVDMNMLSMDLKYSYVFSSFSAYGLVRENHNQIEDKFNQNALETHMGLDFNQSDNSFFNIDLSAAKQRFNNQLSIQDATSYSAWLTSTSRLENNWLIGASFGVAKDDASEALSPYSNNKISARLFSFTPVTDNLTFNMQLGAYKTDYSKEQLFFGEQRKDKRYNLMTSLSYNNFLAKSWQLTGRLILTKHQSNISIYQFDRGEIGIYLRKTFD
ncbi:tetratricopeptide repeat protein [Pseudoalteromonas tunicata]|uniref:tetratricopeptide repeat protein n=1 Tax=Pseudoalteromonas tunicata TaxID=314281 RepID=UPI00273E5AFC|nr:tetratricopeptide repeat protein [Pseudoalteromonas tunicata]MDP4982141.1 tetratricopeptide repeat protein [Pseudoalteromonas tunicata]MDP5213906.1 tetratricopeptide repeat protein [Pseudoalteromonas tunicata]